MSNSSSGASTGRGQHRHHLAGYVLLLAIIGPVLASNRRLRPTAPLLAPADTP